MSYTTLWAYTWDLTYESTADTIAYLKQDVGLDALSVATSYHTYEMLCPHRSGPKFVWAPEAAVYFQPTLSHYENTPIKPNVSPTARVNDPLREIGNACVANGMGLTSWTVCLHNSYLASAYPQHAQVNAFGDVLPHAPCPSSPAVREYMTALLIDLTTNYPVTAIEVETLNFNGYSQGHYHEKIGLPIGALESFLFSLCFCDHCSDRAGTANIDAQRVRSSVAEYLDKFCLDGTPSEQSIEDHVAGNEELAEYVRMRAETVASLTRMVKGAVTVPVYYLLMGNYFGSGMDHHEISRIVDRVEILAYSPDTDQVRESIRQTCNQGIAPENIHAGFGAYYPASPDEETLIATTEAALDEGVSGFSYYNYGIMPRQNLQWVKSAVKAVNGA
ncbi:MAG: hypothetical protein HOH43_16700 [Candidatus Latescibacteria bacterium]|nr:hypothetical protein [Candidatus Latescibacterota bacterium]